MEIEELLNSPDYNVRILGIDELEKNVDTKHIKTLYKMLQDIHPKVRKAAINAIIYISRKSFLDNFKNLDENIKHQLAKILLKVDDDIIDLFSAKLQYEDEEAKIETINMVEVLGRKSGLKEYLIKILKDKSPKVRASVLKTLGIVGSPHDIKTLMDLLEDPDKRVRANAIEAIENLADSTMVWLFLRFTKDPVNRIRANAIKALYKLGYKNIFKQLEMMAESENKMMRASAAWVIGEVIDEGFLGLLVKLVKDSEEIVRKNALIALTKFYKAKKTKKFLPLIELFEKDPSAEVKDILENFWIDLHSGNI